MEHYNLVVVQNIHGIVFNRNDGTVVQAVLEKDLKLPVRFGIETRRPGFSKVALRMLSLADGAYLDVASSNTMSLLCRSNARAMQKS